MPTTQSDKKATVSRKKSNRNENNSASNLVAMVNKSPNGRKSKTKSLNSKRSVDNQTKDIAETVKKAKFDKTRSTSPQPSSSGKSKKTKTAKDPNVTTATFTEDCRSIFMTVEDGEEELDYQDDATEVSEDHKISFRDSQLSSHENEQGDTLTESESDQEEMQTDRDSQDTTEQYEPEVELNARARTPTIEEIDIQVQEKIRELELLVNQCGLKGSAALLNESLGKDA